MPTALAALMPVVPIVNTASWLPSVNILPLPKGMVSKGRCQSTIHPDPLGVPDREGAHVILLGRVHQVTEFHFVHWR